VLYGAAPAYRAEYVLLPSGKKSGGKKNGDESNHANGAQPAFEWREVKRAGFRA